MFVTAFTIGNYVNIFEVLKNQYFSAFRQIVSSNFVYIKEAIRNQFTTLIEARQIYNLFQNLWNSVDSHQIIPKVGLMLQMLDRISLAHLAGCER